MEAGARGRRQLVAVHRLPDKIRLLSTTAGAAATASDRLAAASDLAYTAAAWDAASRLSRSRRVLIAESSPRPQHADAVTMRVETASDGAAADTGTSSAGGRGGSGELGAWINKYQKSDHHADRLVRTIVQYEQATGQRFPGTAAYHTTIVGSRTVACGCSECNCCSMGDGPSPAAAAAIVPRPGPGIR